MRNNFNYSAFFACLIVFLSFKSLQAHLPTEEQTIVHRQQLNQQVFPKCIAIPEGGFVYYFNPVVKPWLEHRLTLESIRSIRDELSSFLIIPFTKEGFTVASSRRSEEEIDETNYSAVWVRDTCWHYFGLKVKDQSKAKKLLLKLLEFYSTPNQINRFLQVISSPDIADFEMNSNAWMDVPLIRFSRKTLSHHQVDGVDQHWNHLQFDSHGLFLLAFSDAVRSNLIKVSDLSKENFDLLSLFPAFFRETKYWKRKDAGPWEEKMQRNASTMGLIAAGLREYKSQLIDNAMFQKQIQLAVNRLKQRHNEFSIEKKIKKALLPKDLNELVQKGIDQVEYNLRLGGEAPDLTGEGLDRRADAALFFLCFPDHSLFFDDVEKIQNILKINLGLVGPYGVFRYKLDAYQSMNYWIDHNLYSSIEGDKTPDYLFLTRFDKGYTPCNQPYDAQWFFDSIISSIYYNLSMMTEDFIQKKYYLRNGDIHLKRAFGQLTSTEGIAANGEKLTALSLPESINTVLTQNCSYRPIPSPICPLGWSTATMHIALEKAHLAHSSLEMAE